MLLSNPYPKDLTDMLWKKGENMPILAYFVLISEELL